MRVRTSTKEKILLLFFLQFTFINVVSVSVTPRLSIEMIKYMNSFIGCVFWFVGEMISTTTYNITLQKHWINILCMYYDKRKIYYHHSYFCLYFFSTTTSLSIRQRVFGAELRRKEWKKLAHESKSKQIYVVVGSHTITHIIRGCLLLFIALLLISNHAQQISFMFHLFFHSHFIYPICSAHLLALSFSKAMRGRRFMSFFFTFISELIWIFLRFVICICVFLNMCIFCVWMILLKATGFGSCYNT